jgi:predicted glycosyltransferase
VLLSFGGFGDALDLGDAARRNEDFFFVSFAPTRVAAKNLAVLAHDHGLPHQDLVLGADVVFGKPGYGTVAEAIVARKPFVIVPRGDFREYPVLVRGIQENLPSTFVEDVAQDDWTAAIRRVLAAPSPRTTLGHDGAEVALRRIRELL